MKRTWVLVLLPVALSGAAFATTLRDVVANPERYEGHHIQLDGILRIPGPFYLFADRSAAAKTDLSRALLIRTTSSIGYREFDRQWVRVTGVISSKSDHVRIPGTGLLLDRVELLRDRPAPRIKDPMVLGVFRNDTKQPMLVGLRPPLRRRDGVYSQTS